MSDVSLGSAIALGQTGRITPDKIAPSFIHGADQAMRMDFAKARAEEKAKLERQKQIDALAGKLELHGGYNSHYVDEATKAGAKAAYDYGNALKSGDVSGAMQIKRLYDEESANRLAQNNELNNFLKTDDGHIIPDEMRKALSLPKAQGLPIMKQLIEQHPVWKEFADVNPDGSYKFAHKKEIDLEGESEAKMASYRPLMNENVGDAVPYGKGSNRYRQQVRLPDEEIAKIATDVAADKSRAAQEIYKDEKGYKKKLEEARAHLGMNGVLSPEVMADKEAEAKRLAVVALVSDRLNGKNKYFIDIQRDRPIGAGKTPPKQVDFQTTDIPRANAGDYNNIMDSSNGDIKVTRLTTPKEGESKQLELPANGFFFIGKDGTKNYVKMNTVKGIPTSVMSSSNSSGGKQGVIEVTDVTLPPAEYLRKSYEKRSDVKIFDDGTKVYAYTGDIKAPEIIETYPSNQPIKIKGYIPLTKDNANKIHSEYSMYGKTDFNGTISKTHGVQIGSGGQAPKKELSFAERQAAKKKK